MATETKTFYPGAYDGSRSSVTSATGTGTPVGKGTSNTTYASFVGSRYSTFYATWVFDVSVIPEDAIIDSVSCKAKVGVATTQSNHKPTIQLYSGDTAKGAATSGGNTTTGEVVTLSNVGTWTKSELDLCSIRITRAFNTTSDRSVRFYGADLTVTYTYQSEKFMLKLGGAWHDVARVFKKVNGIWVEQTDLANVIEDGVRYQNGGEIINPNKTVTITGSGSSSLAYVTINGRKYTAPATVSVPTGTVITCTVADEYPTLKTCYISVDGVKVVDKKDGSYNHTVSTSCTIALSTPESSNFFYGTITVTTGGGSSANLISFTLDGTSYQAEEGMTWGEWVASSYNTAGFYVSSDLFGGYVYNKGGTLKVVNPNGFAAAPDETIASGYAYTLG